jgi:tetratricopeptide (TPR) repeat protein
LVLLPACFGLDEQEEARLTVHEQNSQDFYQRGHYDQALHQADMALKLDGDRVGMRLVKGFCLTKLGRLRREPGQVDEAIAVFRELVDGGGETDYRSFLGAGQANLTRALLHEDEMGRIQRRLASDFLSESGRKDEEATLARESEARDARLHEAERMLRRALAFENQAENPYVLIEMVLVLNTEGDHEDEAIDLAHRAVAMLQESTRLTRNTLSKNLNLEPRGQVALQRRIDENLGKEQQLRDIVLTIEFNRGAWQACLDELDALEERQLITPAQVLTRAGIYEQMGMLDDAIADLEAYLRLRARSSDYDEVAQSVYDRIVALRARTADASP